MSSLLLILNRGVLSTRLVLHNRTQQPDKCNVFDFLMGVINFCGRVLADSINREKKNVLYNVPIFVSARAIKALPL